MAYRRPMAVRSESLGRARGKAGLIAARIALNGDFAAVQPNGVRDELASLQNLFALE
jgi:hypothetical protein